MGLLAWLRDKRPALPAPRALTDDDLAYLRQWLYVWHGPSRTWWWFLSLLWTIERLKWDVEEQRQYRETAEAKLWRCVVALKKRIIKVRTREGREYEGSFALIQNQMGVPLFLKDDVAGLVISFSAVEAMWEGQVDVLERPSIEVPQMAAARPH